MAASLEDLRQTLRRLEKANLMAEAAPCFAFGITPLDAMLGGGLAGGCLHEVAAEREGMLATASSFALVLAAQASAVSAKTVVWVTDDLSQVENGFLYAPGLDEIGLPPERLLIIAAAKDRDVLWCMEEALHCAAVGAVIGEMRIGARGIDPVATRRLSLAAAARHALALLLRSAPGDEPSAAVTRWEISAAPSAPDPHGVGPPRLLAHLRRNRRGNLGRFVLEWHRVEQRFILATDSQPLATPAANRPHRAA